MDIKKILFPNNKHLHDYNLVREYALINGIDTISLNLCFFVDPIHEPIDIDGSQLSIHNKNYIELSYNLDEKKPFLLIYSLAHELGHFFSTHCQSKKESVIIDRVYKKELNGIPLTIQENSIVYAEEKTAWDNARLILKELKIYHKHKIAFEKDAKTALKSYKNLPKYEK